MGAAARAMNTMGFTDLRIVGDGGVLEHPEARAFAHGSTEILATARVYDGLAEALSDRDLTVATTGRRRGSRRDYYEPEDLRNMLAQGRRGSHIAIVFGREESGLSNDELELCELVSAVPMRRPYPSINLGQAVMVYSYALSPLVLSVDRRASKTPDRRSVRVLRSKARNLLPRLGFDPGRAVYQRMIERIAAAEETDLHLLFSLVNALEIHLPPQEEAPESPPPATGWSPETGPDRTP